MTAADDEPIPAYQIPGEVTEVDATGRETHRMQSWQVLPPPAGTCQICAFKHEPHWPHNAQSLHYKVVFNGIVGRMPTWADAIAHCSEAMRNAWTQDLKRVEAWSEPPNGEKPIAHHGIEP